MYKSGLTVNLVWNKKKTPDETTQFQQYESQNTQK